VTLRVLADENIPAVAHYLGPAAVVEYFDGRRLAPAGLGGADALLVRSVTRVDAALVGGSALRFVGSATSGHDHIDRRCLDERGIAFAYAPGSNANSVVEYVLAAIAAIDDTLERLLQGGTVGIVGYGHVGRALAGRLQALGIDFLVYDPWLDAVPNAADLAQILDCQVVSLHCELTRELPWPSAHLLAEGELRRLTGDTLLINVSRGAVVDNRALLRRLGESDRPRIVLDVWEGEPDIDAALLERVDLGTAHIAGYSQDGKVLATQMLCDAMAACLGLSIADEGPALAPAPALALPAGTDRARLLRHLLQATYDIRRDDALLRGAIVGAGRVEAREQFDRLRREYPQRRELAGAVVTGALDEREDESLLRALGCIHQQGEGGG